jgi:hypothetical protein
MKNLNYTLQFIAIVLLLSIVGKAFGETYFPANVQTSTFIFSGLGGFLALRIISFISK